MTADLLAERLQRPLVWVIGAVLTLACWSVLVVGPSSPVADATRAGLDPGAGAGGAASAPATPGPDGVAAPPAGPAGSGSADAPVTPLGPSAVPAAGIHRYEVQDTDVDGTSTVLEERREIEVVAGDRTAGTVIVSARLGGESQVSTIDWSPTGALVRATRIESSSGVGRDCTWDPPFPELGALGEGATWSLDSGCRALVAGVDTSFTVTGRGAVVGEATISFGGRDVRVWQISRDRTTTIQAELAGRTLTQTAREEGTLFLDPALGLVLRSDVTVTLGGTQTGVTRRVSVLQPG